MYDLVALSLFTELCNHHHHRFQNIFIMPKRNPKPLSYTTIPAPHLLILSLAPGNC